MLSNPINNTQSSALQTRRRLHQRQKSMPVAAFEAMKMSGSGLPQAHTQAQAQAQAQAHAHAQAESLAQQQAHANAQQQAQAAVSRQASHRRGQSLDTRRQQLQQRQQRQQQIQQIQGHARGHSRSQSQSQNHYIAPANAPQGIPNTTPQHVMRETQQQRTVRSGASTQQQQQQECSAASFDYYNGPTAAMMRKTLSGGGLPMNQQDFQLFASPSQAQQHALQSPTAFMSFQDANNAAVFANSAPSPQGWASEEETSSTRRSARRVSNGILDRVVKFEGMQPMDGMQRPATPPHTDNNAYFPPTPTETPLERMQNHPSAARLDRFSDEYDDSMEETLKPVRSRGHQSNRSSGVFDDLRQQAEAMALATPQRSNMMQMPITPADFIAMNGINAEFLKMQQNGNFVPMAVPADMQHLSPPQSQHPTPASVQGVFDGNMLNNAGLFENKPDLWATEYDSQATMSPFIAAHPASPSYSESAESSHHRSLHAHKRNESMASIASAASISTINIDEARTETGVTVDDIAAYIDGPNPVDGKWRCTFEKCDKRFGRKENIKSHVQTHLNDRQYQCPHCQKCFVRQHDLKRHAKIHTGIKPYPCECGNNFARHDALTRHRQRGMCIGAFDGAVRKIGKRGRPRKSRPSLDMRREKSTRTRSKNTKSGNGGSSSPETSSYSGYSDNSAGNSPRSEGSGSPFEDDQFMDDELIDMDFAQPVSTSTSTANASSSGTIRGTMNPSSLAMSSAPMPGAGASGMIPVAMSPSAMSHYSQHSQHSHHSHSSHMSPHSQHSHASMPGSGDQVDADDMLPANHPASPAKSVASHYTQHPSTPPELSASSSPPQTTSSTRFFDLDPNSSCTEEDSLVGSLSAPLTDDGCGPLGLDVVGVDGLPSSPLEDEIMLMKSLAGDDALLQLDNSGLSMLNTSKFDDEYGMFTNNDDVFFGN
ncbi:c2h2 transcription factor swi5 [Ophiostoma piceae UAMH 11346]|uniref:C2h2 transcription factor swi5 n=1 Tax=Ophiostoma piceae (strain UAMH 11346) TaxID=1262450 RepID=S3C0F7_OPHP1|nr:c2h2 transcription factor swi5 [Ophiostoma piceae UAMH 11346]